MFMGSAPSKQATSTNTTTLLNDQLKENKMSTAKINQPTNSSQTKPGPSGTKDAVQQKSVVKTIPSNDDIVFETFIHKSGRSYMCMYTNGVRYFLDTLKSSGEWEEFPFKWYNEGELVTDEIKSADEGNAANNANTSGMSAGMNAAKKQDDREGIIEIKGRGMFQTYVFEHRRNIHCYYDHDESAWIKLPINWELKTDLAKKIIRKIQNTTPQWTDERDIMAALRLSNYNTDDCINTYLATEGREKSTLQREKSIINQHDSEKNLNNRIIQLESVLKSRDVEIASLKHENNTLKQQLAGVEDNLTTVKSELQTTIIQLNTLKVSRPKTAQSRVEVKESVSPDIIRKLCSKVKELRKVHLQINSEMSAFLALKLKFVECIEVVKKLKLGDSGLREQIEEVRTLYRREALQRKLLYNQLQEIRGNIRVFCRVRKDPKAQNAIEMDGEDIVVKDGDRKNRFQFDKSFMQDSSQVEIFADVLPIITSCVDGYNISIIAYGQTGSGKTHTMQGLPSDPGVNVRAIKELLKLCASRKDTTEYKLTIGMVEIYNENIQDLLSKTVATIDVSAVGNKVTLPDLTLKEVKTEKDISDIMETGAANRKVASTKMNSQSSRSHLMVMLTVEGTDKVNSTVTRGTLTLVDLAGSERVGKTEASGARLTEAAFINKSLTALGQIFTALRSNQMHIPYRNSKLTHLLQPSLGGDAKACLFVNCSPDVKNIQETISTMQFGGNARQVALGQAKKNVAKK